MKKACQFLLHHQMEDGGWGEDFAVSLLHGRPDETSSPGFPQLFVACKPGDESTSWTRLPHGLGLPLNPDFEKAVDKNVFFFSH